MFKSFSVLGLFDFPVITIFLFFAIFFGAFVFWRKLHNEGAYNEMEIFDGFLLSLLVGFLLGRLAFILTHFGSFGLNIWSWLNFVTYPGINLFGAIGGAGAFLFWYVKKRKVEPFAVLDFWAIATSLGLCFYEVGQFFDGSSVGKLTNLPWGITFPGMISPAQPASLYAALFFLLLFIYLNWAEYHYRTFDWYRRGKSNAQSGFIVGFFLCATGIFLTLSLLWKLPSFKMAGIDFDPIIYLAVALFGFGIIYTRSGRKLKKSKKK